MSIEDIAGAVAALLMVGLTFYLPMKFTRRQRVIAGLALFVFGWSGIFLGLALGDHAFLQEERIAMAWIGTSAAATVLAVVLLVPAGFEWKRGTRSRRSRRELLGTAFEMLGGEWIWYANAWAPGVVVSSDERELYLSFKPLAFRRAIRGRPASVPRRPYWPTLKRLLTAMITGRDPKGLGTS